MRIVALAACIIFVLAGVGSAAFLLFATPTKEPAGAASPVNSSAPQTGQTAGPASDRGAAEQHPPETAGAPGPASTLPQSTVNDPALQSPSGLPLASPLLPQYPQPSGAEAPAKPPSRTTQPTAGGVADRPAVAATEIPANHRTVGALPETHHVVRARSAERRAHLRAARETLTPPVQPRPGRLTPPQRVDRTTRRGGSGTSLQTDQAASFNELIARLTGSAKPADRPPKQVLTPPAPGAPDPFAARPASADQ